MKLEVGIYVRTIYGYVARLKKINKTDRYTEYEFDNKIGYDYDDFFHSIVENYIDDIEIIKASHNIIDILEVGDIIRYRIDKVPLETKGYLTGVIDITDEEMLKSIKEDKNYHVLQILTKEKFKDISYEVV